MSNKIALGISLFVWFWSCVKLYNTYVAFIYESQMNQKYQQLFEKQKGHQDCIWDGSDMVRIIMHHAKEEALSIIKIEPQFSNQFMIIMEGDYVHFVKWIANITQSKYHIKWQKIVIRKISSVRQRYILRGVYRA